LELFQRRANQRLIVDLSSPDKASINDRISEPLSSLSYTLVDHLSTLVLDAGKGPFLTKIDIKEAYRMLQVYLQDHSLLGVYWKRSTYIDQTLPFSLNLALIIISAVVVDAIQCMLYHKAYT